jgi:dipeptidyl aminopeptidase/acylaminoacyl peptidase
MVSFFGTTDIQRFTIYYMTDKPWESPDVFQRSSPITNAAKAKAPALILHGEADRRVPIEQGDQDLPLHKRRHLNKSVAARQNVEKAIII